MNKCPNCNHKLTKIENGFKCKNCNYLNTRRIIKVPIIASGEVPATL